VTAAQPEMSGWAARAKQAIVEASQAAQATLDLERQEAQQRGGGGGGGDGGAAARTLSDDHDDEVPFGAPPPPAQPFAAAGAAVGETYATVCWALQPGALTPEEFEVETGVARQGCWRTASIAECTIEKDEEGSSLWVAVVDELEPREEYLVRVRAKNDAGWGPWSERSAPICTQSIVQPEELPVSSAAAARESGTSSDFGERDLTPHSSREDEDIDAPTDPALGSAPVLARFTQELGGFASKAAKLREDATGVALKVRGDLAEHVSAALDEYQREEEFDETVVVPVDVLAQARDLLARAETPVDLRSRRHWAQLRRIWLAANFADGEDVPLPPEDFAARSPRDAEATMSSWTRLGFQNDDPSTDFRGGGLLALEAMLHFAESNPTEYRAMLAPPAQRKAAIGRALPVVRPDGVSVQEEPGDTLPVALTSINITRMLLVMLSLSRPSTLAVRGLGKVETTMYDADGLEKEREAFFELHDAAILAFDRCWQIRAARWSDFEPILTLVQRSLRALLLKQGGDPDPGTGLEVAPPPALDEQETLGEQDGGAGTVAPPVMRQADDLSETQHHDDDDTGSDEAAAAASSEAARAARTEQLASDTSDADADAGPGGGESDGNGGDHLAPSVGQTEVMQLSGIEVDALQEWARDASTWGVPDSILGTSKDLFKSALSTTRDRTMSLGEATRDRTASVTAGVTASGMLGSLREGAEDLLEKSKAGLDQVVKGQPVAVLSQTGVWRDCRVVEREELRGVKVHYEGFDPMWDEWLLPAECDERMKPRTVVPTVNPAVHSRAPTTSSALDAIVARDSARAHETPTIDRANSRGGSSEELDVETMSVAQLRAFISSAGLSHADCLEKPDLRDRAREAAAIPPRMALPEPELEPEPEPEPELDDAAEQASVGLPAGWDTAVSRTYGDVYYVNVHTGESQYDKPTKPASTEQPPTPRSINAEMRGEFVAPPPAGEGEGEGDGKAEGGGVDEDQWEASRRALAAAEAAAEAAIAKEALEKRQFLAPYGIQPRCVPSTTMLTS
jgi:hypothetical protein